MYGGSYGGYFTALAVTRHSDRFAAGVEQVTEQLAAEGIDLTVDVSYHAYQLDPTASPGMSGPVVDAYAKKFGGHERAEAILQLSCESRRPRVDSGNLASVRRVVRARRDGYVGRGIHVEPPEELRARDGGIPPAQAFPDLLARHEAVRLSP